MKQSLRVVIVLMGILIYSTALADYVGSWSGKVEVTSIDLGSDAVGIILKTNPSAPASCSSVYRLYIGHMGVDERGQKFLYQQSLSALLSGKPVSIFYSADGNCLVANIMLYKE